MQKVSHWPGVLRLKQYRKSGEVRPYDDESFVRVLDTAIMIPMPNTIKHVMPTYTVANPAVTNPQAIPPTASASPTR